MGRATAVVVLAASVLTGALAAPRGTAAQPSAAQPSAAQPSAAQPSAAQPSAAVATPRSALAGSPAAGVPPWAQSVRVTRGDEPLHEQPTSAAPRRGAATLDARLPVYRAQPGAGCADVWYQVGPQAWLCSEGATLSRERPWPHQPERAAAPPALPHRYFFIEELGSFGYRDLRTAELVAPDVQLEPGFAVAVVRTARVSSGDAYGLTSHGLWVPLRDTRPARPSDFAGLRAPDIFDAPPAPEENAAPAWVISDAAVLHSAPAGQRGPRLPRLTPVTVLEERSHRGQAWVRIGDRQWLPRARVAVRSLAPSPAQLRQGERWIDIDLTEQLLTAFEGERPVFTTLISSGRGRDAAENATPLGEHRVWIKLVSSDMDNLETERANRYYAMQSVPWVMFFHKGYGLHGVYWHDDFGARRSHGCVNLSPRDAAWLFAWTGPHLPAGWSAVLPTRYDPGTLVRVRAGVRARDR